MNEPLVPPCNHGNCESELAWDGHCGICTLAALERLTRELACVTAERDRAQRACEQMGEQLTVAHATKLGPIQHYVCGILQDRKRLRAALERVANEDIGRGERWDGPLEIVEGLITIAREALRTEEQK